ncbi:RNA 2',3'-cyclic phosphodiesterase [Dyella monticola]|nr:RNA 2',3'-cyclic phosphodiesterase [Dyella monticola]
MPSQASLPGFEPAVPTDRLFLAAFPNAHDAAQLAAIANDYLASHHLEAGAVETSRLHVTLFHLGDYTDLPPALVDSAGEALSHLTAESLTIRFDQIGSFGNRQSKSPLVLAASDGNERLHALHKQLATHLRTSSLGQWTHGSYVPHMTVAYGKATMPLEKIEPITWAVNEVLLIHSLLGKTRHIRLASKALL